MIDRIISFGDSFTYGSDLSDCDGYGFDQWSELTWPALCAKELGLKYHSFSQGGVGNQFIAERLMSCPWTNKNNFVIVNWTWIDRFDYWDLNYHPETVRPGLNSDISNMYYKHLHSDYSDLIRNLTIIHSALCYLKNKNVPFISTVLDQTVINDRFGETPSYFKGNIQELIKDDISWFPNNQTFLEWSRANNYPESDNWHPLEQAHEEASKIMLPTIKKVINTHIT